MDILETTNKFWNTLIERGETTWGLPFEVVLENENLRLLKFSDKPENNPDKQLIIPPRSGHDSTVAKRITKQYVENNDTVYVIEHKAATQETKNHSFTEAIDNVLLCIDAMNTNKVGLTGLCQGGNIAQFVAALFPEKISSLITAGTPADFQVGGGKLNDAINPMSPFISQSIINLHGGVWPGYMQLLGFKMMNPQKMFVEQYKNLWGSIEKNDEKAIKRFKKFDAWYEKTLDLPGEFVMDVLVKLFINNDLIKGNLEYKGRKIELSNITCPVGVLSGDSDDISSQVQCESLLDYVSSDKKYKEVVVGVGHIGVYLSNKSILPWDNVNEAIRG